MRRPLKILSIAAGSLLALVVLAALGLEWYARTPSFRARIQAAASRGMGMEVELRGPLSFGLFPSPHLTLRDVRIHNRGVEMGTVELVKVRYRFLPLLRHIPEIETLALEHPRILVTKGTDGVLDIVRSTPPVHKRPHGPMEVVATDGVIRYEDRKTGAWVQAEGCDAEAHDLRTEAPDGRPGIERLSFKGDFDCHDAYSSKKVAATGLKATVVAAGKGVYLLQPVTLQVFGSQAVGSFHADLGGGAARYTAALSVRQVDVGRFLTDMGLRQLGEGQADFAADVRAEGRDQQELMHSLSGDLSLRGKDLTLEGYDLDGELKRFEHSQRFSLIDMGAAFVAGPLGLAATKGYDFARIKGKGGGTSPIHVLVSDWKVSDGMATAEDVAISTDTHRMALQGKVDLPDETFDGVTVAVVDAQGCVIAEQQLEGTFRQMKLKKHVLAALAGPVRRLVNKGENALTRKGCTVFYDGSVRPY